MRLKKIVACTVAATMVLGSLSMVSAAETLTGTAWWTGMETSSESTLPADYCSWTYTIESESDGPAFNVEVYDSEGYYITTGSIGDAWYAAPEGVDAATTGDTITGTADDTGDSSVYDDINNGDIVTVTIERADSDFAFTYSNNGRQIVANNTVLSGTVSAHVMAQWGTITIDGADTTAINVSSDTMSVLVDSDAKALPTITTAPAAMKDVLTYESDNEAIATVDADGNVSGVGIGTATITISYGDYSATVDVNVVDEEVPLTGITLSDTEISIVEGATATVTATPDPEDTTDDFAPVWNSADETIATVADGVITGVAAGTTTVTATVGDLSASVAVTVTEATVVGNNDEDESEEESEEEEEEGEISVVEQDTFEPSTFWTDFTTGYEITEDMLTLTFTTTSNGTNYYENAVWALYSSDSSYIATKGADSASAIADNYVEYWVGRADYVGWGSDDAVTEIVSEPDDWDAWYAATQAGATVTITAYLDGDNAIITCSCEGYEYKVTVPVTAPVYLALSGENCTLSDLTVNGEDALFQVLTYNASDDEGETEEESEEAGSTTDGTTTGPQTVTCSQSLQSLWHFAAAQSSWLLPRSAERNI